MEGLLEDIRLEIIDAHLTRVTTEWDTAPQYPDAFTRLYLVTDGTGVLYRDGLRSVLTEGNEYLVPAGTLFSPAPSPGLTHIWIHFTARAIGGVELFDLISPPFTLPCGERSPHRALYRMILDLSQDSTAVGQLEKTAALRLLIAPFIREARFSEDTAADRAARFQPIIEHIERNLEREISVSELAGMMRLNVNYFSNLFSAAFSVGPRAYMLKTRIRRAQLYLWSTGMPIKAIAAGVGFTDVCYFSRTFKRITGITPGGYRKRKELISPSRPGGY